MEELYVQKHYTREMFNVVGEHFGDKKIVGVEVGTSAGINAIEVLNLNKNITKLYCIDCYLTYAGYTDYILDDDQTELRNNCISSFARQPRTQLIMDLSTEAAKQFKDKSVDFVYIDANHAYKYIKEDIEAWLPKIKKGGIIGGHDWDWTDPAKNNELSVKRAVEEQFGTEEGKIHYHINLYEMDEVNHSARVDSDWWVLL